MTTNVAPTGKRRGRAPPIDPFTGEDPEIRFQDWLPALIRTSKWNQWTAEEDCWQDISVDVPYTSGRRVISAIGLGLVTYCVLD